MLEGGYSDRALMSGAMAHLVGLVGCGDEKGEWWSAENLDMVSIYLASLRFPTFSHQPPGSSRTRQRKKGAGGDFLLLRPLRKEVKVSRGSREPWRYLHCWIRV